MRDAPTILDAQSLLREYEQFLRASNTCGANYAALEHELATLPAPYAEKNGAMLLALVEGDPAGCIAYRAVEADATSCDIKRLFVRPEFRGHGLARKLVEEAIAQAKARGYRRAILDTDADTMPAALALYLSLGFRPYKPGRTNLSFLELGL